MIEAFCSRPPQLLGYVLSWPGANPECRAFLSTPIEPTDGGFGIYLRYFLMTCLLETPGYALGGVLAKQRPARIALQIVVLNLATHPFVYLGLPWLLWKAGQSTGTYLFLGELFAFGVEALLLRKWARYSWSGACLTSTAANLTSWWVGVWLVERGLL